MVIVENKSTFSKEEVIFVYRYCKDRGLTRDDVAEVLHNRKKGGIQISKLSPLVRSLNEADTFREVFNHLYLLDHNERNIIRLDGESLSKCIENYIRNEIFDNIESFLKEQEDKELDSLFKLFSLTDSKK